jgi:UDP-glucose 4-epimerase
VHVHDVARALLAAVGKAGVFNVSTGVETDVAHIFERLQAAAGTSLRPLLVALRPGELERSCMDPSRTSRELHWRAEIDLEEGLSRTYHALVDLFEAEAGADPR